MEGVPRALLQAANQSGDTVAPFFGFIGAASALVFACEFSPSSLLLHPFLASGLPRVSTPVYVSACCCHGFLSWPGWGIKVPMLRVQGLATCSRLMRPALSSGRHLGLLPMPARQSERPHTKAAVERGFL